MTGVTARWAVGFAIAVTVGAIALPVTATAKDPAEGEPVCEVTDEALAELSGLVAVDDGYWAIGDGTDDMTELAITHLDKDCNTTGTLAGYWAEGGGPDPYDPEDLAIDGDGTLWVADTGDNDRSRTDIAIHQVTPDGVTSTFWFSYPDGPHDTEALLLQPDGTPLFASKDAGESRVYRPTGPVDGGSDKLNPLPLEEVASVKISATETPGGPQEIDGLPLGDLPSTLVTGGSVSPKGDKVVLRTYTDAYEWEVADGDVAAAIADGEPTVTPLPNEPQGESIAYTSDGKQYVTSSEGAQTDEGFVSPQLWTYAPGAAAGDKADEGDKKPADDGKSFLDTILDTLGPDGILQVVGGIGVVGLIMVVVGVVVIVKARRRRKAAAAAKAERDRHDDHDEPGGYPDPGRDDDWEVRQRRPEDDYHHDGYDPRDGHGPRRDPRDDGLGGGRLFEPTGHDAPRYDRGYDEPRSGYGDGRDGYDEDNRGGNVYGGRY